MTDESLTGAFPVDLPKDLVSEAKRVADQKEPQFRVETWRRSWFSRISEMLVGED